MSYPIPWFWIGLVTLLLLLPGPMGRFLLNVLGGITLTLLLLPVLAGAAAWIGWQFFKTRLRTCPNCGFSSLGTNSCPVCGQVSSTSSEQHVWLEYDKTNDLDARSATINVEATSVNSAQLKDD